MRADLPVTPVQVFSREPCLLGEAPFWSAARQSLLWLDIAGRTLHEKTMGGPGRAFGLPCTASLIVGDGPSRTSVLLVADTGLHRFFLETATCRRLMAWDLGEGLRSNDGGVDPWGNLWFGSMERGGSSGSSGSVYSLSPAGRMQRVLTGIGIPNTFCWSQTSGQLYLSDSLLGRMYRYDCGAEGISTASRVVFVDLSDSPGTPDGAAMDDGGGLWCALWGAGRVVRYLPDGSVGGMIDLPVPQPSSCCFGGPENRHLLITSAREGLDADRLEGGPLSGAVFSVELPLRGAPTAPFAFSGTDSC